MRQIERLTDEDAQGLFPQFIALLQDAVHDGASVGFLRPLPGEVAGAYWQEIFREVRQGSRVLLAARGEDGTLVGSVQLGLCTKPNGLHRAEVQKLLVLTQCRRQGIAKALMSRVEREAREAGRTLLYLDTEPGKPAARMYAESGWVRAGEIPDYACTPDGQLHGTLLFYRRIWVGSRLASRVYFPALACQPYFSVVSPFLAKTVTSTWFGLGAIGTSSQRRRLEVIGRVHFKRPSVHEKFRPLAVRVCSQRRRK